MTSGRTDDRSVRAGTTDADEEVVEPFRAVLEAERQRLAEVSRAEHLTGWRSRVIQEVMSRRSAYAQVLRRDHGNCSQDEFLQTWQSLLTAALERIMRGGSVQPSASTIDPVTTTRTEDVATAILAAVHGGATLSWLADDPRSLEAALDIALAPVLSPKPPNASGVRRPR